MDKSPRTYIVELTERELDTMTAYASSLYSYAQNHAKLLGQHEIDARWELLDKMVMTKVRQTPIAEEPQ